jgi:hypothetical protein
MRLTACLPSASCKQTQHDGSACGVPWEGGGGLPLDVLRQVCGPVPTQVLHNLFTSVSGYFFAGSLWIASSRRQYLDYRAWWMMKWKGFQRKRPWHNGGPIPPFAWKNLKNKPTRIACVSVEIRNPNFPSYRYANWLDPYNVDWFMGYLRLYWEWTNKPTELMPSFVITTSIFLQLTPRSEHEVRDGLGG